MKRSQNSKSYDTSLSDIHISVLVTICYIFILHGPVVQKLVGLTLAERKIQRKFRNISSEIISGSTEVLIPEAFK